MALRVGSLQALVYDDEGVSSLSSEAIALQLRKILDASICVKKVDSAYLLKEPWEKNTVVLAMGGGRCSAWEKNLGDAGIRKIQEYVKGGGKYLGFCAGAYFGAHNSYFQAGNGPPIVKKRPYYFLKGRALGPLWEDEDYLAPEAAKAPRVHFQALKGKLYYQGGCYFEVDDPDTEVLGVYEDFQLPAAVLCPVGKGRALLCGLHPEFEWKGANCPLAEELKSQEEFRHQIWEIINDKLNLDNQQHFSASQHNFFKLMLRFFDIIKRFFKGEINVRFWDRFF